jgi:hypothetical protein
VVARVGDTTEVCNKGYPCSQADLVLMLPPKPRPRLPMQSGHGARLRPQAWFMAILTVGAHGTAADRAVHVRAFVPYRPLLDSSMFNQFSRRSRSALVAKPD